jgi:dTDP-3,4-didehydro-2,6-dideoxy-alpha-D-glucose 3-reductase
MIDEPLKLGILGCAAIVPSAIINPLKEIDHIIAYGIASREKSKAENYAARFGIPQAFGGYDDLLHCQEIDFVYIALPNAMHVDWIIKSAEAGKHILVEKPICLNSSDFRMIEKACQDNHVHILEALMVQHHPWQSYLGEAIRNKPLGNLKTISTRISEIPKNNYQGNYRSVKKEGGGSFLDVGCYWIQFIQKILGFNDIASYYGESDFSGPDGCDWTFRAGLTFRNGIEASFTSSFELPYQSSHILEFEHGRMTVKDFFRACLGNYKINIQIEDEKTGVKEKKEFEPQCYYSNQLRFFADVLQGREKNIDLKQSYERIHWQSAMFGMAGDKMQATE